MYLLLLMSYTKQESTFAPSKHMSVKRETTSIWFSYMLAHAEHAVAQMYDEQKCCFLLIRFGLYLRTNYII